MYYEYYDKIVSKYFDQLQDLPAPIREARIFAHTLAKIPLSVRRGDHLAGWYGVETPGPEELDFERKSLPFVEVFSPEERRIKKRLFEDFQIHTRFDRGHTCIDYGTVIQKGLRFYREQAAAQLNRPDISPEKRTLLEAMLLSLDAVPVYSQRFAALAKEQLAAARDPEEQKWLSKMVRALEQVPMEPARDFYEGVTSLWLTHSLVPLSDHAWWSISLGRVDQYLYPLYCSSLEAGEPVEDMKTCLCDLFVLLDNFGDAACALNIGGMDPEGRDQMNPLSQLIIQVEKEMLLSAPLLVARVHPNTPEAITDQLIDRSLFQIGQPTFYGEMPCRRAMMSRGIPEKEACGFSVNSCMGLVMAGQEIASMWGCVFNMHLPLELVLNLGKPLHEELPYASAVTPEPVRDLEHLYDRYRLYLEELLTFALGHAEKNALEHAVNIPNPFLSALTDGCMERGLDRAIGSRYHTETVEAMAMINTGNAIHAIDCLVFRQKKYTIPQLLSAARNNYDGEEALLHDLHLCEKYGTGSAQPDGACRRIGQILSDLCEARQRDNFYFLPSLHTLDSNVGYGGSLYATLDGRKAGQPVNKNAGPTNDVRSSDPTGLVRSAATLDQARFSGGQPIDVYFDPEMLDSEESRVKIRQLICTYFELGGLQFQVNSADPVLLRKAYEHPEQYQQLIVRIGGYSTRFVNLSRESQLEFIQRFERESART